MMKKKQNEEHIAVEKVIQGYQLKLLIFDDFRRCWCFSRRRHQHHQDRNCGWHCSSAIFRPAQ